MHLAVGFYQVTLTAAAVMLSIYVFGVARAKPEDRAATAFQGAVFILIIVLLAWFTLQGIWEQAEH